MIILNNNLDDTTSNNIKNMVDSGNINGAISQISPEMIQNFSKMFAQAQNNQQNTSTNSSNTSSNNFNQANNNNSSSNSSNNSNQANSIPNNFDLSGIDLNSIMKIAGNMNQKNDPRSNLLASLKPYLRDGKKEKLDNYINLLNMSKIAETLKNTQNNTNKDNS